MFALSKTDMNTLSNDIDTIANTEKTESRQAMTLIDDIFVLLCVQMLSCSCTTHEQREYKRKPEGLWRQCVPFKKTTFCVYIKSF